MRTTDTCIVLPARLPTAGSLMGFAAHALIVGMVSGVAIAAAVYVLLWSGRAGRLGMRMEFLAPGNCVLVLLIVGMLCGVRARAAIARDGILDDALVWSRRLLAALGTQIGDTPVEFRAIRVWLPARSLWVVCPGGWTVLLVLCVRELAPMWKTRRRWSRRQRQEHGAKAAQCLDEYTSALDATTLASPTGTYFGCLVHPVAHAPRARLVRERLFGGLGAALVPGLAWGGGILAYVPFGRLWWGILMVHVLGAVMLWTVGVLRVRWMVALAWDHQWRDLRFTLRAAESERDAVMRLIENSTVEGA